MYQIHFDIECKIIFRRRTCCIMCVHLKLRLSISFRLRMSTRGVENGLFHATQMFEKHF